jgi:hypothetical protein
MYVYKLKFIYLLLFFIIILFLVNITEITKDGFIETIPKLI